VIDDEALELGDDLRVPAELEFGIDLLLDHRVPELIEAPASAAANST
jgi:hypothetical protein